MNLLICSMLLGFATFHYTEGIEYPALIKFRDFIYFKESRYEADTDGMVMNNYLGHKRVYNPVTIAQTALIDAQCFLSQRFSAPPEFHDCSKLQVDSDKIIKAANWFLDNGVRNTTGGVDYIAFYYNFPYPKYSIANPWLSGMAQGQVIEVLLAAFELTQKEEYYLVADLAANTFKVSIDDGGVLVKVDGGFWFEEYASTDYAEAPLVLNGHLFALDSLFWLKNYNSEWDHLYEKGINALEVNIESYHSLSWSYYDLAGTLANGKYHRIHISQLKRVLALNPQLRMIEAAIDTFETDLLLPFAIFERLIVSHNRYLIFAGGLYSSLFFFVFLLIKRRKSAD